MQWDKTLYGMSPGSNRGIYFCKKRGERFEMKPTHFEAKNVNVILDADGDSKTIHLNIWNNRGDVLTTIVMIPPDVTTNIYGDCWDVVK